MKGRWLHEQFAAVAAAAPDAVAVVSGERALSYAELDQLAAHAAGCMAAAGVSRGDVVALSFFPEPEQIVCMLAVMRCGAAWVSLDPDWPAQRQRDVLSEVHPRLLIVGNNVPLPHSVAGAKAYAELVEGPWSAPDDCEIAAADLCYVMFTSGSTGQPNGVQVSHGNVAGLLANVRDDFGIRPQDNWSAMHSAAFGFSLWECWGALSTGGRLVIVPQSARADPYAWDALIREQRVSVLSLTPSGLRQWLAAECQAPDSRLRLVVLSGEPLTPADAEHWFRVHGSAGPRLVNTYALTETAGRVAIADVRPGDPAGLLGRPARDAELFVLDPQTCKPVAPGATGELFIAGPIVARGYLNNEELTAQRFVQIDPGDGRQRLCYRSGDRAMRLTDGRLQFAGRDDAQIKLRGHRVEPADIEAALQAHPQVQSAAVVPVSSADSTRLHAFAVPDDSRQGVEFWPSLGEYQVYDDLLYDFMSSDQVRVDSYRRAFERCAGGKVVLDIGTGKDALLARLAAQSGARHVYAVEVLPDAAAHAAALIERLGLQERITVICGDMDDVEIPEPVELCTQGIVGNIGSSDGIAPIWNRARRFFAPQAVAVPARCTTFIAPASLPAAARERAAFSPLAADYTRRVFAGEGRSFDVRLCVRNFSRDALLADAAVFEDLDFNAALSADYTGEAGFEIAADGWLDGFLLWTCLEQSTGETVDFLEHQQAWLPVWFPVGNEPLRVAGGDRLTVRWTCATPEGQIFPDYRVETRWQGKADAALLTYESRHHQQGCNETALHRALLASLNQQDGQLSADRLHDWLSKRLPEYMVPSTIELLPRLPLNSSSKLDRDRLQQRAQQSQQGSPGGRADQGLEDLLEQSIAGLWREVLQLDAVGADSDFFAAGGDSITAVRLTTEVQRLLDEAVFLAGLYEAPTVAAYANWLRAEHPRAVERWLGEAASGHAADEAVAESSAAVAIQSTVATPLSAAQQSLYFLQQLYPDNTAANEQFLIRLQHIDVERLQTAWAAFIRRHDILSVRISDDLRQHPDAGVRERLTEIADVLDLSAGEDADAELRRLAAAEIRRGFNLAAGGLLRPVLVKTGPQDWCLLVTAHHIVADGLCVPLIRDELFDLYQGRSLPPPEQFADYVCEEQARVQGDWLAAEQAWWRSQLEGATLQPVAALRGQVSTDGPERRIAFEFDRQTSTALRELAHAQGASLFVTLLTLWRAWLARCFEREDFLLGSPVTRRNTAATRTMLGCLVNNLAFRNPLDLNQGFSAALDNERRQVLAALDHSALPFEKIVQDLQPERVFGRHPLFQFMFQFEDRVADRRAPGGEVFGVDVLPVDRASYWDFELSVTDQGAAKALQCFFGIRDDLFDAAALAGWSEGINAFARALTENPGRPLAELPLLSERQQAARAALNQTAMPVPAASLFDLFRRRADSCPEAAAVRDDNGVSSYAELLQSAQECAARLQTAGVTAGSCVGVCLPRGVQAITLLLAINRCGASWLALDPDYPPQRLAGMLADVKPELLVTEQASRSALMAATDCQVLSWDDLQQQAPAELAETSVAASVCVLFTSGSTGDPKGAWLSQQAAVSRCLWMWQQFDFGSSSCQEIFAQRTSLNFVDAVWEIFGALLHGGCVAVAPRAAQQDMALQARWVTEQGVSHAIVFPSALPLMLDCWRKLQPLQLQKLIITGEPLTAAVLSETRQVLPHCRLLNTYGTSENWDITAADLSASDSESAVTVGRPVANAHVYVLDRNLQALPDGVAGQVCVGGLGVGRGYLNRPELSAERFVGDLADPAARVFITGDLGSFNQAGELRLHGRADRQLKLRGVRVEPGEIEALARRQPGVQQAALVLQGEANEQQWLALYLVASGSGGDPFTAVAEMREALSAALPASLVPADIAFVDDIPRTPSGKVDVLALQQSAAVERHADELAATETERVLCHIWSRALGIAQVGRHDNFFALRGNSLLATRVTALMCDAFNVDLPLACLFESPTVAELAGVVELMQWNARSQEDPDGEREVVQL